MVRPDVVLFGEQLPDRFFRLASEDFPVCDLLLVFGTSLAVALQQPAGQGAEGRGQEHHQPGPGRAGAEA